MIIKKPSWERENISPTCPWVDDFQDQVDRIPRKKKTMHWKVSEKIVFCIISYTKHQPGPSKGCQMGLKGVN